MNARPSTGRILHGQLHLLDRQIVEHRSNRLVAKVDDVELDMSGPYPVVTALLTGGAAWGPRLPGLLGRAVTTVHRRLHDLEEPAPDVIGAGHIVDVTAEVRIDGLDMVQRRLRDWVDEQVVRRIPGASHAAE
jgi:ribosomal protein S10